MGGADTGIMVGGDTGVVAFGMVDTCMVAPLMLDIGAVDTGMVAYRIVAARMVEWSCAAVGSHMEEEAWCMAAVVGTPGGVVSQPSRGRFLRMLHTPAPPRPAPISLPPQVSSQP